MVGYHRYIFFLSLSTTTTAFLPSTLRPTTTTCFGSCQVRRKLPSSVILSSSPSSPENENEEDNIISFDQAGASLMDEQDNKRMDEMGDFDENPDSSSGKSDSLRDAIRARAADLGVEKSAVSAEYIKQAEDRAKQNVGNQNQPGQLDLSQISSSKDEFVQGPRGEWDESLPSMLYNPEDEMTEEEKKEVDQVGSLPFYEQFAEELKNVKWPTPGAATRDVGIMFAAVAFSAFLIIGCDRLLRTVYTDLGFIPSVDDIASSFQGIDLPDGWTNNMNEDDIAQLQDEMSNTVTAAPAATKAAASSIMDSLTSGASDVPDL